MRLSELVVHSRIDAEFAAHPDVTWQHSLEAKTRFLPLEKVVDFIGSGHTPYLHDVSEGDIGFVTVECVGPLTFNADKLKRIHKEHYDNEFGNKRVSAGSVLCTIKRRICQAYPFIEEPDQSLAINQDIAILKPKPNVRPAYLATYLSSRIGQSFADRQRTEQMNPYISVSNLNNLPIAEASEAVQDAVQGIFLSAQHASNASIKALDEANDSLVQAVGLTGWLPPDPLTYTRRAWEVFAAERVDAEHYAPKFDALIVAVKKAGVKLEGLGEIITGLVNGVDCREFVEEGIPYIRVGDVKQGRLDIEGAERVQLPPGGFGKDVTLQIGDVLFTRKGSFGNAATVQAGQEQSIISSEIMRVRRKPEWEERLLPEYLAAFFNSILGSYQAEKYAHGVAFYSVSQEDLRRFLIPILSMPIQKKIRDAFVASEAARCESRNLLDRAKRAVEIAIEQSEAEALRYMSESSV